MENPQDKGPDGLLATDDPEALGNEVFKRIRSFEERLNRQVETALRHKNRLDLALNHLLDGVIVLDESHCVVYSNRAAEQLLSVAPGKHHSNSLFESVRIPAAEQSVERCFSTRETEETEFETNRGPRRTLAMRATWMENQRKPRVLLVLNDITSLRQLETMRSDFVANVSHELKTPLSSIKAYAETLRMGGLEDHENRLKFVTTIQEQAERLHQLIIDLIQLSRIEKGQMTWQILPVDLCSLVSERIELSLPNAEKAGIFLKLHVPDSEIWGLADDEGMQTVADNLISNAIRYTPHGGEVNVTVRTEDSKAVVEVRDTGIGIAPHDQERIFERFYRVDKARSREKGGTGLGLSIVKHLVQSFKGEIHLESSIGRGSCFTVSVPLDKISVESDI